MSKKTKKRNLKRKIAVAIAIIAITALAVFAFIIIPQIKKELHPREFPDPVEKYAEEYNVPEALIYAVIQCESSFDPNAVSPVGAQGLMQLMPETFQWLNEYHLREDTVTDFTDPETNIKYGTFYLSFLYKRYGNWETAIAAYNAGHGKVDGWLKDSRYSNNGETLYNIPYEETYNYVNRVFEAYNEYSEIYYHEED